tara:strand:- start:9989 stop:10444 length:456 start_codon:yes stop_codon:yes gene_type:complete
LLAAYYLPKAHNSWHTTEVTFHVGRHVWVELVLLVAFAGAVGSAIDCLLRTRLVCTVLLTALARSFGPGLEERDFPSGARVTSFDVHVPRSGAIADLVVLTLARSEIIFGQHGIPPTANDLQWALGADAMTACAARAQPSEAHTVWRGLAR